MGKVFDDGRVTAAFRAAERALAAGEPDVLAGRFSPHRLDPAAEARPPEPAAPGLKRSA